MHMPCSHVFGADATFHHIGIAVLSILEAAPDLTPVFDPIQKVSVAFMHMHDLPLELIGDTIASVNAHEFVDVQKALRAAR